MEELADGVSRQDHREEEAPITRYPDFLPTLSTTEQSLLSLGTKGAPGLDTISGRLLRLFSAGFVPILHPLQLKCNLSIAAPFQWSGGALSKVPKGCGLHQDCNSSRQVLVCDHAGKAPRKLLRDHLVCAFDGVAPDSFAGCPKGRGTDTASHTIRAHLLWLKQHNHSGGVLFADIATAYYAVIKELGTGLSGAWGQRKVARIFEYTGCGPECFHEFLRLLDTPAQGNAGVSRHLTTMVTRLQENTWSVMQGSDKVAVNATGTRPGDPLAEVLFAFMYQNRIGAAVERFRKMGLFPHHEAGIARPV